MKLRYTLALAMIAASVAAVVVQEDPPTQQPTPPGLLVGVTEDRPLSAAPTPSMRKSFTMADLQHAPAELTTSPAPVVVGVEGTASSTPGQVRPTPRATTEHHGLVDILDATPSPTMVTSALSMPRGLPLIHDDHQAGQRVSGGHSVPMLVQQSPQEHHHYYHHPWGPNPHYDPQHVGYPPYFGQPPLFGPPHVGPTQWGPLPFEAPRFRPSPCDEQPHWRPVAGPQWVSLAQVGAQWQLMPTTPVQEPPSPPQSTPSRKDSETDRVRQAFRMHIGAKGNGLEAFVQELIKAMSGTAPDISSNSQLASTVVDGDSIRQHPEQVPDCDDSTHASGTGMPVQPQPTPAATDLSGSTAPDPFAFSYSSPPETPPRTVRVTAPPYEVDHAELTNENFAEHKFSPSGLTQISSPNS